MSKLPEQFVAKKAWADYSDDDESEERLNIESLAALVGHAVKRTDFDPNDGTSQHFEVGEYFVDIMYRSQVTIIVSPIRDNTADTKPAAIQEVKEQSDSNPWQEVSHARSTNGIKQYHVFRDSANDHYMGDFVATVHSLDEAKKLIQDEPWAHIYCEEEQKVYDFCDPYQKEMCKVYNKANATYKKKFGIWKDTRPQPKTHKYAVFQEGPNPEYNWPQSFRGFANGLNEARQMMKMAFLDDEINAWGHAYSTEQPDEIFVFNLSDNNRFISKTREPDDAYRARFAEWLKGVI